MGGNLIAARTGAIVLALAAVLLVGAPWVRAEPVADFYRDKRVQIYVGYGVGGGYDSYARLIARHLGRHIPGQPGVVVQNMPGAGSLRAANFIFTRAPKDGTAIGTFSRNMILLAMLGGNAAVQFDPRQFIWLGSPSSQQDDAYILWVRKDARVKSLDAARGARRSAAGARRHRRGLDRHRHRGADAARRRPQHQGGRRLSG